MVAEQRPLPTASGRACPLLAVIMGASASCCRCSLLRNDRVGVIIPPGIGERVDSVITGEQEVDTTTSLARFRRGSASSLDFVLNNGLLLKNKIPNAHVTEDAFQFHHLIDTGGFGFVFKATRKATGLMYAMKVQPMEFMTRLTRAGGSGRASETSLQMEKTALIACRGHPFVVSLEYCFHTSLYAILALEYVPGTSVGLQRSNIV